MLLKIIGLILLTASCTGYGYYKSMEYRRRLEQVQELRKIIFLLSGEIACRKTPLAEACQMLAARSEKPYGNWLWTLYASMTRDKKIPFCKIWEEAAEQLFTSISLPEAEQNELKRLGKKLGSSDGKMQEQALNWYGTQLEELESAYRMTLAEKQKLCRSLGILAGLFLAVLFI